MVDVPGSTCNDEAVKRLVDDASAAVLINHVEPKDDMVAERQRASFDSTALSVHLNGGAAKLERKCVLPPLAASPPPAAVTICHADHLRIVQLSTGARGD